MQLGLAHRPLQPEQQTVVEQRRMIDAVGISDQRIGEAGKIDEAMPIGVVARQARNLQAQHEADMGERDLGGQARKARPRDDAGAGQSQILVDDDDLVFGPAKLVGLGRERILAIGGLAIVLDLGGARLAQIDDGLAGEMAGGDFGAIIHRSPPSRARPRACGR